MSDKLAELMKDELFAKGYEVRRQAFGDEVVEQDAAIPRNDGRGGRITQRILKMPDNGDG